MQPNASSTTTSSSIYINPKFRAHINPNFLSKSNGINQQQLATTAETPAFLTAPTQIYVNPRFFGNTNAMTQSSAIHPTSSSPVSQVRAIENDQNVNSVMHEYHDTMPLAIEQPLADTKIHTRTKICNIRAIATTIPNLPKIAPPAIAHIVDPTKMLIKIGSKKLLRVPAKAPSTSPFAKSSKSISKLRRPLQTKYKIVKEQTTFKIDRRSAKAKLAAITLNVLPTVVSRKLWINESLTPTKTITRYEVNVMHHLISISNFRSNDFFHQFHSD